MLGKNQKLTGLCAELEDVKYVPTVGPDDYSQLLENDNMWKEFVLGPDEANDSDNMSNTIDNEVDILFKKIMGKLERMNRASLMQYCS
jgi:hypothetical protein